MAPPSPPMKEKEPRSSSASIYGTGNIPVIVFGIFMVIGGVTAAMWVVPFPTRQEINAHNAEVELEIKVLDSRISQLQIAVEKNNLIAQDTREKIEVLNAKFEDFKTFVQLMPQIKKSQGSAVKGD